MARAAETRWGVLPADGRYSGEATALGARQVQLLEEKLQKAEAALEEERQLSNREREVMAERLRFAQNEEEAARERLSRALSSLRGRAREGAAEVVMGHSEECIRLQEECRQLQASRALCEQEVFSLKNVQQEQNAQLALVSAERDRLSLEAKQLKDETGGERFPHEVAVPPKETSEDWDHFRGHLRDDIHTWHRTETSRQMGSPRPSPADARSGMLELRCQELQSRLERALLDAEASRQRTLELELQLECERGDSRARAHAQEVNPKFLGRAPSLEQKRLAEAQAKALGDSERRCRDGLRRMDAMLADTKELTRELAKQKYLSQGMDVVRRERLRRTASPKGRAPELDAWPAVRGDFGNEWSSVGPRAVPAPGSGLSNLHSSVLSDPGTSRFGRSLSPARFGRPV